VVTAPDEKNRNYDNLTAPIKPDIN
jgi:hypothetical protein